jgi:hypothetical protein
MVLDAGKFAALTTEALQAIKTAVEAELTRRFDTSIRVGALATFEKPVHVLRTVEITKINQTTVTARETGLSVEPGKTWRCHMTTLKMLPRERSVPKPPPLRAAPHRPAGVENAW